MRGQDAMQEGLFTVAKLDDFVPADLHPLRAIRVLVNDALTAMNGRFNEIYAETGRDSIAPEKLIRSLLLLMLVLHSQRAPVVRATALQPAVSLVRCDGP